MTKYTIFKKISVFACVGALTLGLFVGCGKKDNDKKETSSDASTSSNVSGNGDSRVINIAGYEVGEDVIMTYALLTLLSGSVNYTSVAMDEASYKNQVINNLLEDKLLYEQFIEEGREFTDEDVEVVGQLITSFKGYVGQDILDMYGITDKTLEDVFLVQSYADKYENDRKNEIGLELTEKYKEALKDYNFQSSYYIMIPTIESDENGDPAVDADGNYIPMSDEDIAAAKETIETVKSEIESGADVKAVVSKYKLENYSQEQIGYVGMYNDEMNEIMGSLEVGKCTDIFDSEMGYYMIALLTTNDKDLLESFAVSSAKHELDSEFYKSIDPLYDKLNIATASDVIKGDTTVWDEFSILDMAGVLDSKGILQ